MTRNILLLCTGNICRSPMAEGLMRECLPTHEIFSAGLHALDGASADRFAIELMWQVGIDISAHRARSLASWMMREADLILTMDGWQQQFVAQRFPSAKPKLMRLGELYDVDIPDPYQKGLPAFQQAYRLIERSVHRQVSRLAREKRSRTSTAAASSTI